MLLKENLQGFNVRRLYQIFGVLVVIADVCCFLQWEMYRNQNSQVASDQQDQTDGQILLPVQKLNKMHLK